MDVSLPSIQRSAQAAPHVLPHDAELVVVNDCRDRSNIQPNTLIPASYWREFQDSIPAVHDLRRLMLQNIFVAQGKTKTVDEMWLKSCEADRARCEQMQQVQRLEIEVCSLKADLAVCGMALKAEQSERKLLAAIIEERDHRIAERNEMLTALRHQLDTSQAANRDLSGCTAKLADTVWDLSGVECAQDEVEDGRIEKCSEEQEAYCAHLLDQVASLDHENSRLQDRLEQSEERYARFCAESNAQIVQKDHTAHTLRSFLHKNGLYPPI